MAWCGHPKTDARTYRRLSGSRRQAMKSENRQPFEVQSYIGSEIAELREDGERPPTSAKFLETDPNPAGGVCRTDLLSTNRERSVWTLWEQVRQHAATASFQGTYIRSA
jgi:hypothetical protein